MSAKGQPKKARKPRRRMRGSLAVIGGLLISSALVRIGSDASQAFARETAPPTEQAAGEAAACTSEADIAPILAALNEREDGLKKRESDIRKRMQALSVAETEIDRKMSALVAAEEKLRGTIALADTAAEDDLTKLTDVYATMKPKQAAALFEEMDPEFSAGFLGRMRPDAAAAIMAGLSPTAAYTISVILAGRNAEVPKQ
ncbi:hypothetical protein P775_05890 [Puniceibacterium antarcticum]|uniref:Magnesium transporter MgtE intracellular domain-containing protein n=1 Tax=Puniceibacterium antarcticum TaxID=1206336 RepID=A0A2G8RHL3_9RHOB|nr:hypothetical protein [Puniceibacterium antarcticum]PIL21074.1 hypothetical protein P775_05890 [Puniceibacterium antarcticum]